MKISKKMWLILISLALILILASVVYINRNNPFFKRISNSVPHEIFTLDGTKQNYFDTYGDLLLIINNDGITALDKKGKLAFEVSAFTSQPLARVEGKYILLADQRGKEAYLINDGNIHANIRTEAEIITGSVSETGMFVLVTNDVGYRSKITVYNQKGEEVYAWKIGENYVIDACISKDGKKLAASVLSTANNDVSGGIAFADIPSEKVDTPQFFKDKIFTMVRFNNDNSLVAIGESSSMGFSSSGKQKWTIDYAGRLLQTFAFKLGTNLVLAFKNSANNTNLEIYSTGDGKKKGNGDLDYEVVSLDVVSDTILAVGARQISQFNHNGTERVRANTQRELRYGGLLNNRREVFVVGGTSVEVVKP